MSGETLRQTIETIGPLDEDAQAKALAWQDDLTKVPGSLGDLEAFGVQLCAISGQCPPPVPDPAFVGVFEGDHGVQTNKVSPWPQEITYTMGVNLASGGAAVSVLARHAGAGYRLYNVGGLKELPEDEHIVNCRVAVGTADLTQGPAMTREQATQALEIGIGAARDAISAGARALVPGELGIGNTTPAAALIAAYTGRSAKDVTGRGAGADDEMLARKTRTVEQGLAANRVTEQDALGILAGVGGFEHAAMAGFILGGAASRVPVVLDGVIAVSAALAAVALAPRARSYLFAGHLGPEPGLAVGLEALGLTPLLQLGMRLGEGSGAALALPVLAAAAKIMREMSHFSDGQVSAEKDV
ncbi:nicotinate-nucleotide--dimethylbenzimidazole phosphoribosyltransferase [Propionibacterium australiense]|uniref:Nicotinate-nucleotide--dimethylbenzimidazole phosphoribosyltransferase n=1 Tax=Propionibacterium australiense TaxID=119981 RepID=A0A383S8N1_9ACTN|nr:nicotinate-nucleotide--dimethylbenzimidazole phosphoribosyltransferase [Propionibacterium australiense]RLP06868.1 nicotinate-nucleotide--dimethylbenzimidazole phosphoribosyltransferase [Propionibacterium australiense]RLP08862.1 nicotinate-nucleotide--dimethylbenzimidazole phosphoribosyltransferase [Propionibacterium australiense]SYZ34328.1 nicotinate-nucleotide-dimethylbenzimidazole phosphoribosyltransferase [Propionibacterium australiense]VEH90078.1 Nicotinate-nucleotide--dimethylbenzimidaz